MNDNNTLHLDQNALQTILDRYLQSGTFEEDLAELPAEKRVAVMEKFLSYMLPKAAKSEEAPRRFSFTERLRELQ